MSFVFVPLYIHFMGIEAYGLMGVFAALLGLFALLDMGLSSTMNREMARLSVQKDKCERYARSGQDSGNPVLAGRPGDRGDRCAGLPLDRVSLGTGEGLVSLHCANRHHAHGPVCRVSVARRLLFRRPVGLQRQVLLNGINVGVATCRGCGAVLILWLVSPTVEVFFLGRSRSRYPGRIDRLLSPPQLAVGRRGPRFRRESSEHLAIRRRPDGDHHNITLLMQLDKIILSRMLSLEMFGYYSLANVVAMTLYRLIGPVFSATYPKLTGLVELGAGEEVTRLYHKSAELVSVLLLPAAFVVALFSREILLLWTRSPANAIPPICW